MSTIIMSRYLKAFNLSFLRNSFPVFGSEVDQRGRLSAAVVDAAGNLPDVEPDQNVKKKTFGGGFVAFYSAFTFDLSFHPKPK